MISRLDSLHDTVTALEPLVRQAQDEGDNRPLQIWRTLQMEDSPRDYYKTVGHRLPVVQMCLESLDGPGSVGCSWGISNPTTYNELFEGE